MPLNTPGFVSTEQLRTHLEEALKYERAIQRAMSGPGSADSGTFLAAALDAYERINQTVSQPIIDTTDRIVVAQEMIGVFHRAHYPGVSLMNTLALVTNWLESQGDQNKLVKALRQLLDAMCVVDA